ncbi:MFS transporter [Actinomadura keratinilytica]|uniref:EamA domain-containing protein n=1 Tax=Actinomadura keratinilytica TaxID=547461 RepID=A0ABP7XVX1_9ACTN
MRGTAPFSGACVNAVAGFATLGGFLFLTTLYLQNVRSLNALHAGLWLLPMAVMTFLCAPLSGHLAAARPAWWVIAGCGAAVLVVGWFTASGRTPPRSAPDAVTSAAPVAPVSSS